MVIVDANVLIGVWNAQDEHHALMADWVKRKIGDGVPICAPWVSRWAFLRIATSPRLFPNPLSTQEAFYVLRWWDAIPNSCLPEPGSRHTEILQKVMEQGQVRGPMVSDAVLAAIAIEYNADLASTDRDFSRFKGLKWIHPLE